MTEKIELIPKQEEIPIDTEEIHLCKNCNYCRVIEDRSKKPIGIIPVPGFYNMPLYPNIAVCRNKTFIMNGENIEALKTLVSLNTYPQVQNVRTEATCKGFKPVVPRLLTETGMSDSEWWKGISICAIICVTLFFAFLSCFK